MIYSDERFQTHLRQPYNRGICHDATRCEFGRHPFCGDQIQIQLVLDSSFLITKAWHSGSGCMTCLTSASILCEYVERKSLSKLRDFSQQEMLNLLGIKLTPLRQQCALVAYHALQQLIHRVAESSEAE